MAGIKTDLGAIVVTATAQAAAEAKGCDMRMLIAAALQETTDLTRLLKQIVSFHPSGGGDATNYTTLSNAINNYLS
jgi:hypothetical protein